MDNMARSRADDKLDPANFPEDTGFRLCNGCGVDIKTEEDVEEFDYCLQHLSTVEGLREECFHKVRDIKTLYQRLTERDGTIAEINKELSFQKGLVADLHALLNESLLRFDRMNQLVQVYEKLLKV